MSRDKTIIRLVGAGSIGSFTDFLLAIIARNKNFELVLYDFDVVEPHNTRNQIYWKPDVPGGTAKVPKVTALKKILCRFSDAAIHPCRSRVEAETELSGIVVVMVDSLHARQAIFRAAKYNAAVPLYIDARSGGKRAIVYGFDPRNPDHVRRYEKTLEGNPSPPPCADADTIPVLFLIAGTIGGLILLHQEESLLRFTRTLISIEKFPMLESSTQ